MSTPEGVRRWTAPELLDLVLDAGTFTSWDEPVDLSYAEPGYRAALEAAAAKAGTDESVLTGRGEVRGRPVAVVVNEFRFLAGSIGRVAADRITAADTVPPPRDCPCSPARRRAAPGCRRARPPSCGWPRSPGR